jgi:hypothetical protein
MGSIGSECPAVTQCGPPGAFFGLEFLQMGPKLFPRPRGSFLMVSQLSGLQVLHHNLAVPVRVLERRGRAECFERAIDSP